MSTSKIAIITGILILGLGILYLTAFIVVRIHYTRLEVFEDQKISRYYTELDLHYKYDKYAYKIFYYMFFLDQNITGRGFMVERDYFTD